MAQLIGTRPPSGFRDYPPNLMIPRERLLETARRVYRSHGYVPIDTPAAESLEVLLGKGGDESDGLVYRIRAAKSETEEMGLRFDLTVPFARFAARHVPELGTPFKRYALGPVWRGERPGKGRYREFWQCDFDIIGTQSDAADIEIALVIHDLFTAFGIERFQIHVNNRKILNGVLQANGLSDNAVSLLRSLDKLAKIGRDKVIEEMTNGSVRTEQAETLLDLAETQGDNRAILAEVEARYSDNPLTVEGVQGLRTMLDVADAVGMPKDRIRIDLSICRGLDYYTGTIYETFLTDLPSIGSVCSGGRYDNLAGLYTKQLLPGVGASLGVDRFLAALEELKHPWLDTPLTTAEVLILQFDADDLAEYQKLATELRQSGVSVEVYPDAKKPKAQFEYADKRGFRYALMMGPEELAAKTCKLKDLQARAEETFPRNEVTNILHQRLR